MTPPPGARTSAESTLQSSDRLRPWWVVTGCALALLMPGALIFGFPGVMAAYWQDLYHVGKGAVGSVIFFSLAGVGVLNLATVWLPPRFTPRARMYAGTATFALSLLILAAGDNLWQLYLWAFISGAGSVLIYVPAVMLPQSWVPGRRGLASGVVSMMFGLSAAFLGPVLHWMLASLGYQRMLFTLVVTTLLGGFAAMRLVRYPPARPVEMAGHVHSELGAPSPGHGGGPQEDGTAGTRGLGAILGQRRVWALWATWALMGGAGIAMVTLAVGLGVSKGYSAAASLVILTAFNVTNGTSRLVTGTLSDTLGRTRTMTLAFVPAGLAYLVLPYVGSLTVTALLAAVVGFGFGTLFAVSAPLVVERFGIERFTIVFSLVMTAYGFFAGLLGPAAAGHLLDISGGDYRLVLTYLGSFCLVSAALVQSVRPRRPPTAAPVSPPI